mmetsp:Transcript_7735/g.18629  ORF Transcript_7735/g.18629 Transcript_7735/m.18629 type:complete len:505 (-) Transcript_7735:216-1730(-)
MTMKGTFHSAIALLSTLSLASAFGNSGVSSSSTSAACVQQKLDLSAVGSAILYSCGDNQSRGAAIGTTRVVDFALYIPTPTEVALAAVPEIGYVAAGNNVQCALGSTVTVLQFRNESGWFESGETFPPPLAFDEQCPDTITLEGRWIEPSPVYVDCSMEDFQCNWVIVPDEFYGSTGPYYIQASGRTRCMVPNTYIPVCQASNLERFNDYQVLRGDGLALGVEGALPSLSWYNNIATTQENRWVCSIPQGAVVEIPDSTPLSVSATTRQASSEAATLYVCEGDVDACILEFEAPPLPVSNDTDPLEMKPVINSTQFDGIESTSIPDVDAICQQMEVLSMEDGPIEADGPFFVLSEGISSEYSHAFCSDGAGVALPGMPSNPEWLPEALTETAEWVAVSGSRECQVPHLAMPPNFHPALTCGEGFNLVASIESGFNSTLYHSSGPLYLYGDNATLVSDKFNALDSLVNVTCRQRVNPSAAAGIGSWAQLKIIATASVLLMTLLAW